MNELSGRKALITGGTQGVGAAIAVAAAKAGADVLLVGLRRDSIAEETLRVCRQHDVQANLIVCDLYGATHSEPILDYGIQYRLGTRRSVEVGLI